MAAVPCFTEHNETVNCFVNTIPVYKLTWRLDAPKCIDCISDAYLHA